MSSHENPTDRPGAPPVAVARRATSVRGRRVVGMLAATCSLALLVALGTWRLFGPHDVVIPAVDLTEAQPAVRRAIESAQRAVKDDPQSGLVWGRLGMVFSAHEYSSESVACFREAQRRDRSDVRWPYLLAIALEINDPPASLMAYREAIWCGGALVLPRLRLAELWLHLGELDEAEVLLSALINTQANDARIHFRMAQLLVRRGRSEAALRHVEAAHVAAPHQRAVAELRAQIRHATRRVETEVADKQTRKESEASATGWPDPMLEEVRRLRRDGYWRASQALQLIEDGKIQQGLAELEQAASEAPTDWTLSAKLARAYLMANRLDAAERQLNRAVEQFPRVFDLFRLRGSMWLLREQWDEAVRDFQQALALKADDAASHADLGFCLQQIGDRASAKREFIDALRLNAGLDSARLQFAKLLLDLGDPNAARDVVSVLLRTNPDHTEARAILDQATANP